MVVPIDMDVDSGAACASCLALVPAGGSVVTACRADCTKEELYIERYKRRVYADAGTGPYEGDKYRPPA